MSNALPIDAIEADSRSGVVRALRCGARRIELTGGGCEFGDWYGFFSHEKMGGNSVEVLRSRVDVTDSGATGEIDVRLPKGEYRLRFEERLREGRLDREYVLEGLGAGALGDFVIRTTAAKTHFPSGEIREQTLAHIGENRMHQHAVRGARLIADDVALEFQLTDVDAPGRLGVYTYLRDEPTGLWVMHHRLLTEADASDEYVLRVRYSAFTSARSWWVRPLRRVLWRACERNPWIRPTIQVGGNINTEPGERWTMRSTLRVTALGGQGNGA